MNSHTAVQCRRSTFSSHITTIPTAVAKSLTSLHLRSYLRNLSYLRSVDPVSSSVRSSASHRFPSPHLTSRANVADGHVHTHVHIHVIGKHCVIRHQMRRHLTVGLLLMVGSCLVGRSCRSRPIHGRHVLTHIRHGSHGQRPVRHGRRRIHHGKRKRSHGG